MVDRSSEPKDLSKLTRKELTILWTNFIWDLKNGNNKELSNYLDSYLCKSTGDYIDDFDIDERATFLCVNHPNNPLPFKEEEVTTYDGDLNEIKEKVNVYQMTFNIACENVVLSDVIKVLIKNYKSECLQTIIKLIARENLIESCFEGYEITYNFKLISPKFYKSYGFNYNDLWISEKQFESNRTPDEIYRFRGLDMSGSHIKLAKSLMEKGFLVGCEAAIFPLDRADKSYIRPDLIIFHKSRCLFVEVDGPSHWQKVDKKNGKPKEPPEPNAKQYLKDRQRDRIWAQNGFTVMRFTADEALLKSSKCVSEICDYFNSAG